MKLFLISLLITVAMYGIVHHYDKPAPQCPGDSATFTGQDGATLTLCLTRPARIRT